MSREQEIYMLGYQQLQTSFEKSYKKNEFTPLFFLKHFCKIFCISSFLKAFVMAILKLGTAKQLFNSQ